jgi:hypothetical protein
MRAHLVRCSAVAIVLTFAAHADLFAQPDGSRQERLFALAPERPSPLGLPSPQRLIEIDTRADSFGTILASTSVPRGAFRVSTPTAQLIPLAGGRYILTAEDHTLSVFDTTSGSIQTFAVSGPIVTVDTHRPRVFFVDGDHIRVFDARSGASFALPAAWVWPYGYFAPGHGLGASAAYAGVPDRLFVMRQPDPTIFPLPVSVRIVDVVDVASAAVVQSITTESPQGSMTGLLTDSLGTRLFVLSSRFFDGQYVSVYDVPSGQLVKRLRMSHGWVFSGNHFQTLQLDEQRRRLWVGNRALDSDTLDHIGATPRVGYYMDTLIGPRSPLITFSSVVSVGGGYDEEEVTGCLTAPLARRDPDSGVLQRSVDLVHLFSARDLYFHQCFTSLAMTTVPPAPRALTADVRGQHVTLSWIDSGNTTHFQVEGGSGPGLADLYEQAVGGTSLTVRDVPAGTYYVRVRAVNYVGRSLPVEVAVVVR